MLATANNNEGQQQRIADDSVITQYGVPGGGGQGLRQSQRQSSWSSLLCCVRPPGEECVRLACPNPFRLGLLVNQCTAALPRQQATPRSQQEGGAHVSWPSRAVYASDSRLGLVGSFEPCSPSTVSSRGFRKITPPPYVGRASCPPKEARDFKKKTLVLDLDETLVHSSFRPVPNADYIIPVEIDNKVR